jgi:solute carrier family 25 phosphate transporter 3
LGPTALGYSVQGFLKYGFYEFFKKTYVDIVGQEIANEYSTAIYLMAGVSAETIADLALTPLEAVRIRLVSQPTFATGVTHGLFKIRSQEGFRG